MTAALRAVIIDGISAKQASSILRGYVKETDIGHVTVATH